MVMVMESVYPQPGATSWQNLWTMEETGLWNSFSEVYASFFLLQLYGDYSRSQTGKNINIHNTKFQI